MATQSDNAATKDSFINGTPAQPGYFSATHYVTETGMPEYTDPAAASPEEQPPVTPAPTPAPQPEPEVDNTPEEDPTAEPPEFKMLDAYMQKQFGAGLKDVVEMLTDLGNFRNQQLIQQQQAVLRDEWGADFDTNLEIVKKRFAELPDAHKPAYDNPDGARRLLAEYMVQMGVNPNGDMRGRHAYVPPRTRRTPPGSAGQYDFTQAEINDMARNRPQEYDSRQAEITRAYQLGRVRKN